MPSDAEARDLVLNQQRQATTIARLQFELEAHVKDIQKPLDDFARHVMDPKDGLVVKVDRLELRAEDIESSIMRRAANISKIPSIETRLETIEQALIAEAVERAERAKEAAKDKKDRRQWGVRDVLVPAIMSVLVAVIVALLTANLLGH